MGKSLDRSNHPSNHHQFRSHSLGDAQKAQRANIPDFQIVGENDLGHGELEVGRGMGKTKNKTHVEENVRGHSNRAEEKILPEIIRELSHHRAIVLTEILEATLRPDTKGDERLYLTNVFE